jgi:hypothetical protein
MKMKKIIKSSILLFTMLVAIALNGCDALENFLFDLPIDFEVTTSDSGGSGGEYYCLDDNETYNDYVDKLNSIVLVEAHIVTLSISPGDEGIQGDGELHLYEGIFPGGAPLITVMDNGIKPADHFSPNGYKINLTQADIEAVNTSLANGNTCFYADYVVNNVQGANGPFTIVLKIDVLFQLDTSL